MGSCTLYGWKLGAFILDCHLLRNKIKHLTMYNRASYICVVMSAKYNDTPNE